MRICAEQGEPTREDVIVRDLAIVWLEDDGTNSGRLVPCGDGGEMTLLNSTVAEISQAAGYPPSRRYSDDCLRRGVVA